ncbi:hypothetical protein CANCADRAFT_20152, partial [Tortispora caseinolytica NRRL Y-17796]
QKRKKAYRACLHCQKAHLTCDNERPCKRCVRRKLADTCRDGQRKRAKYLMDVAPQDVIGASNSPSTIDGTIDPSSLTDLPAPQPDFNLSNYDFGSEAANLEYSVLSNILGNDSPSDPQQVIPGNLAFSPLNQEVPHDSLIDTANVAPTQKQTSASGNSLLRIYDNTVKPYFYTEGYHRLIQYLRKRFDKPHLMRVARAMAAYRPSFIACMKTLVEDDMIFMERCFQRSLYEYEKFISYSGTPTVVWRRTGEIAAVGKEFCILTGWRKSELINEKRFIMELMDDESVVEYFEVFSQLAFGDSRGATLRQCTLLSPGCRRIRTACAWTVRRDVFDIPMMIVGNFLPIL